MSALTQALLCNIDYEDIITSRRENFKIYFDRLQASNGIEIPESSEYVPMVYPYFTSNGKKLKQSLIQNGIYVATYWPNVLHEMNLGDNEYQLADQTVCLPLDQRICKTDILFISDLVLLNG